jgi:hypothetical protein
MNLRYRATQIAVAYVITLAGGLTAAAVALRAGARAVERTAGVNR